jgi:hypothetical protein
VTLLGQSLIAMFRSRSSTLLQWWKDICDSYVLNRVLATDVPFAN